VNCPKCQSEHTSKFGKDRNGNQRYKCMDCKKTFGDCEPKPLGDMRIGMDKAVFAIRLLLEGMSIRATERLTGLHRDTLCDLVLIVGRNCAKFLKKTVQNVTVKEVECDELWGFIAMKEKTRMLLNRPEATNGDCYTYVAMERNTKLVLTWHCGKRDSNNTWEFIDNLRFAAAGRFQVSTDGYKPYTSAIPQVFESQVDFAQLIKQYGGSTDTQPHTRYSPAQITSIDKTHGCGNPDFDRVCTSHSERLNLSVRMACRRMTRLTNGHSKSWQHHEAMLGLFFAWYNWVRKHQTIKTTPAVANGIATEPWSLQKLLMEAAKA
jgi:transposase-like protein/IS1 family transposase